MQALAFAERLSPAQSGCPARLQKLELQIHNSSGTPWLFVSCCEQMEELQIKPSAAREPLAFPTHPRRQQQSKGGGEKREGRKRERSSQPFLHGLSCHLSTPTCKKWGLWAGSGPLAGIWRRVVLSQRPWMLGEGRQRESGVTLAARSGATHWEQQAVNADGSWQRLHSLWSQRGN